MELQRRIANELDSEKLISAVKARSGLYNKNDNNYYCDRKQKVTMWMEVCREVFKNWDKLKPTERTEYCREAQKRWKNLRTAFARELNLQRKEKKTKALGGKVEKRRKKYEYYEQMLFLKGCVFHRSTVTNMLIKKSYQEESDDYDSADPLHGNMKMENEDSSGEVLKNLNDENTAWVDDHTNEGIEQNDEINGFNQDQEFEWSNYEEDVEDKISTVTDKCFEDKILNMLKECKKSEDDEDRQFMLSLVPSFKKLTLKEKFDAKIEILQVLKKYNFGGE